MRYGWLVVNGYMTNPKFLEIYRWLLEAGERKGVKTEKKTNIELMERFCDGTWKELARPDFVIFWDKDVRLAYLMEECGFRLFNPAQAIAVCDDKALTYLRLKNTGICMPKTWIAPKTFAPEGYIRTDSADMPEFFEHAAKELGYPLVVKECFGSFGRQVHLAVNESELLRIIAGLKNRPFLLQEYVETSRGRDIRIQMVGDEAVACMYRYNENDFRANITNGGKMKPYRANEAQIEMARSACRRLKLDFAGVDILFGKEDKPVLCEVNSNAHFKNIYDCTGINAADYIFSYIMEKL